MREKSEAGIARNHSTHSINNHHPQQQQQQQQHLRHQTQVHASQSHQVGHSQRILPVNTN
jgi:hypothetical protein